MMRRCKWTRRRWLWVGAALLLAAGAGAGIRNQDESAAAATASTLTPVAAETVAAETVASKTVAAETTVVETTAVRETLPSSSVGASLAPVTAAGVRAFIDPATGELTASPTQTQLEHRALQARSSSVSRSVIGLRPFELSRGGRGLNLQGRFQTSLRVERGADGNFYQTCGDPAHDQKPHAHDHDTAPNDTVGPGRIAPAPVQ